MSIKQTVEASESGNKTPCRKRQRNVNNWKNSKRKHAQLSGQSYTSTSGKVVEEMKTGHPCKLKFN